MLNTLWTVLLLAGIGWGTLTGNARATGEALLEGAASGVSLCMTMFGVLALWSGRYLSVLCVHADHDMLGTESADSLPDKFRIFYRTGSDDHTIDAERKYRVDILKSADTAAELYRDLHTLCDCPYGGGIYRATGQCAVQIHQMKEAGSGGFPENRHIGRRI